MMKPELKAKWIAALRSGEYKQGRGTLHMMHIINDEFCCLGVLCEIAKFSKLEPSYMGKIVYFIGDKKPDWEKEDALAEDQLTRQMLEYTGLPPDDERTLIDMNDGIQNPDDPMKRIDQKSFDEIANWIEENL